MTLDPSTPLSPYEAFLDVGSSGRVFLAKAMVHYCTLQWGLEADEAYRRNGDRVEGEGRRRGGVEGC